MSIEHEKTREKRIYMVFFGGVLSAFEMSCMKWKYKEFNSMNEFEAISQAQQQVVLIQYLGRTLKRLSQRKLLYLGSKYKILDSKLQTNLL